MWEESTSLSKGGGAANNRRPQCKSVAGSVIIKPSIGLASFSQQQVSASL